MIEQLKARLAHDEECSARPYDKRIHEVFHQQGPCNCTRREILDTLVSTVHRIAHEAHTGGRVYGKRPIDKVERENLERMVRRELGS